ncbi:hypothetical protein D3C87_309420 [compost metagenome]
MRLLFIFCVFLLVITASYAQRRIESPKVVFIEQEGDSVFCREKEICFEVLDFEFDSCNFYNNRFFVSFRLVNKTDQPVLLSRSYISWYDTHSLRPTGSSQELLRPNQSTKITLESVPYLKKKMNSPGNLQVFYGEKELKVPMRLKQESSKVKHCREGQELIK